MTDLLKKTTTYGAVSIFSALGLLLQSKAISYLAGPSGFGVYSAALALLALASTISQWGLSTTLVSFLSKDKADLGGLKVSPEVKKCAALTLIKLSASLGFIGGLIVFYFLKSSPANGDWLLSLTGGIAVALTTLAALNTSIFTARGQAKRYAAIKISSIIISTPIVVASYFLLGVRAVVPALLLAAMPLALLSRTALKNSPEENGVLPSFPAHPRIYQNILKTSSAVAVTGITSSLSSYLILFLISRFIDTQSVGLFSAALAVSIANINFLLQTMSLDYFPRLCKVIHDQKLTTNLINTQIQFNLALAAPILSFLLLMNKEIVLLLYSPEFSSATSLIQIFVFCGFIRLIQWPLGFLQLAIPLRKTWIFTQTLSSTLVVMLTLILVPYLSLMGSAISYLVMYMIMFCVVGLVSYQSISFKFDFKTVGIVLRTFVFLVVSLGLAWHVHSAVHRLVLALSLGAFSSGPSLSVLFPNQYEQLKAAMKISRNQ